MIERVFCDDFIQNLIGSFSAEYVTQLLTEYSVLSDAGIRYEGKLQPYIFLYGNTSEVYTEPEITYINSVDNVIIYSDYTVETKRAHISSRVVAAALTSNDNILQRCIALEKIIDKATDGLNIFFLVSPGGVFIGCSGILVNERDYILSKPARTKDELDEIMEGFLYLSTAQGFVEYYSILRQSILPENKALPNFEDKVRLRRGPEIAYLNMLSEIEREFHLSMSRERERYLNSFEQKQPESSYLEELEEAESTLFAIKSNKVNTMEMLFDAEEMEKLSEKTEKENEELVKRTSELESPKESSVTSEMLNDPEAVIKLLKRKRGL